MIDFKKIIEELIQDAPSWERIGCQPTDTVLTFVSEDRNQSYTVYTTLHSVSALEIGRPGYFQYDLDPDEFDRLFSALNFD